jgi:hypothetical protein
MTTSTVLDEEFNVESEEGTSEFELLPKGKYTAEIVKAVVGPTKNGKGQAVSLDWTITEGQYERRLVFQNILLQHESADAQKFGRQKFKDVCDACGIREPVTDLDVLTYKPCLIQVGIRTDKTGQYSDKNEVKSVKSVISGWNGNKQPPKAKHDDPDDDVSDIH